MLLMILGAGIGYIWGVVPACIGFLIGMMVNAIASDQAVAGVSHSNADNTQNVPILDDFVDDDRPTDLFVADNGIYSFSSDDDYCSTTFLHDETEYNPANGLAMSGGLDIEGNLAGFDSHHCLEDLSVDMGCDHSFMDSSMDDSFGCGMDDW